MRIKAENLVSHLQSGLQPIYVIGGEEPLLVNEAADAVRDQARSEGYTTRERLDAGSGFDWSALQQAADTLSLFAERRILELRLPEPKPGTAGAKALESYAQRPAADTLLMVITGRLDKGTLNSRWIKALDRVGVIVTIWPISPRQLPGWIAGRLRQCGLELEREAIALLADRVEGNLLAANQEIERLRLLHGSGRIDTQTVLESVADSARFDVYKLADAALAGDAVRCCRILEGLRVEGVEPVLVLWALAREVRALAGMAYDVEQGRSRESAMANHRVWESRKPLVAKALQRAGLRQWRRLLSFCAHTDRVVKGQVRGEAWEELRTLVLAISGAPASATPGLAADV
ncbi:MAG: DNA polymerase III subunit delta [Gammaproteobacteria bacterium]